MQRPPLSPVAGGLVLVLGLLSSFAGEATPASSPDAAAQESRLLQHARQLTFEGKRSGEGYFSADGAQLIFQSEREPDNPFYQIYLLDLETGDTRRISPGHGKTTCAWIHPGGEKVLFASTQEDTGARAKQKTELEFRASGQERRYSWDYDPAYEIFEYDLRSQAYRNLTRSPGYDAEGAYSPDGKRIVFASNRTAHQSPSPWSSEDQAWIGLNPSYAMDLYSMNEDGSGVTRLTSSPGYDGGPFFSANGRQICWRRFNRDGTQAEIHVMNADGSEPRQLTSLGALSWAPFFHPSGSYLIFTCNREGFANFELYLVDAAGAKQPVRVTFTDGFDGLASFSPDGRRLAWTSNRTATRQSQIFLADWNHETALELLAQAPERGAPASSGSVAPSRQADGGSRSAAAIREEDLRSHVSYLASPELAGRLTGSEGERLATEYVARAFQSYGLEPFDASRDAEGYFQTFEFTAGVDLGPANEAVLTGSGGARLWKLNEDWRPLSFSELGSVEPAEMVFAGYGIEIPAGQTQADGTATQTYTSYYHTDVKGKWVLVLRYLPEDLSGDERRKFLAFASLRHKAMIAREKGARGIIFAAGPNSKVKEPLVPLTFDASMAHSGLAVISLATPVASELVAAAGKNLQELQTVLDRGEMMPGLALPGWKLQARIDILQRKESGRNVLARLPASTFEASGRPALLLGAHIDHLGNKPNSASRALGRETSAIHPGADDNASGVAGLLEIAQWLADQKASGKLTLERDILFAAWSGEELGLLGSAHFARELALRATGNPDAPLNKQLAANLNLDMVGRLDRNLILQGTGSSPVWTSEIERRNAPVGLPITTQQDTYLSTDATTFYLRQVPILSAFTGAHEDYHLPSDTAEKLNYPGAQKTARFMALVARSLAQNPEPPGYLTVAKPEGQGRRANLRVYLGTIPDYAQSGAAGVKISGASKGSPAEKAGLQAGDIIIHLAGKEVKNIYDYTYVLEALKVGEEVPLAVMRQSQRVDLKIIPASRD